MKIYSVTTRFRSASIHAFVIVKRFLTKPVIKRNISVAIFGIIGGITFIICLFYLASFVTKAMQDIVFATGIMAIGTLVLAFFTYWNIRSRNEQERRDRKESVLNEVRDWIFSIKDITLKPITEGNIVFRQHNIELNYGIPMSRVELLEIEVRKILEDQDLNKKVSKVAELIIAVMVLDKARYERGSIDENVIEAFPRYVTFVKEISNVVNEEAKKGSKSREFKAYDMWKEYIKKLNNAETDVLEKIVSLKSDLLEP